MNTIELLSKIIANVNKRVPESEDATEIKNKAFIKLLKESKETSTGCTVLYVKNDYDTYNTYYDLIGVDTTKTCKEHGIKTACPVPVLKEIMEQDYRKECKGIKNCTREEWYNTKI